VTIRRRRHFRKNVIPGSEGCLTISQISENRILLILLSKFRNVPFMDQAVSWPWRVTKWPPRNANYEARSLHLPFSSSVIAAIQSSEFSENQCFSFPREELAESFKKLIEERKW